MRKNYNAPFFSVLSLLITSLLYSASPAYANSNDEMLRFQFTITDFYDPLLSPEQNEQQFSELNKEKINITGTYEPIKDTSGQTIRHVWQPGCMTSFGCAISGKEITEKTYTTQEAESVSYDPQQRQIDFELPKPINKFSLVYILKSITITTPFVSIQIPYQFEEKKSNLKLNIDLSISANQDSSLNYKINNITATPASKADDGHQQSKQNPIHISQTNIQSSLSLTNPDPDDRYPHVYLSSNKGFIANLNALDQKSTSQQQSLTFSDQEKKKLFASRSLSDYGGFINIDIPKTLPSWYQINNPEGNNRTVSGLVVNDQNIEAVILEGDIDYDPSQNRTESYYRKEFWLRSHGDLTHIYLTPIHIPDYGCDFIYGITFFPDGTEERYFAEKFSFQEKFDDELIDKKKIFVTTDNLTVLDEYETSREAYYANQQEKYPSIQNGLFACKRMITDAKRLLGSPKEQLEKEFDQYKNIIEAADMERRKGY